MWMMSPLRKSSPASLHGCRGGPRENGEKINYARSGRAPKRAAYNVSIERGGEVEEGPHADAVLPVRLVALRRHQFERDRALGVLLLGNSMTGRALDGSASLDRKGRTRISRTSFGVLPITSMPFTSITSSPGWMRPERSAAPPCITRAITILPVRSSVLIVAPCSRFSSIQTC